MTESTRATVGNYIVVNTHTLKGLRINVEKLNSYAMNTDKAIGLAWSDGNRSDLKFDTTQEAQDVLDRLDAICLK